MDLVNSVTQNSNNRNTTMENQAPEEGDNGNKNSNGSNSNKPAQQMASQATSGASQPRAQVPDYLKAIGMDPRKFWPKKYRFTREKSPGQFNPLTISQRNFYEANGYIVIEDCASKRLLEAIKSQHKTSAFVEEFLIDKLVAKNSKLLQYVKCFCDERLMLMTRRMIDSFQALEGAREAIDNNQTPRQQLFRDWIYLPFRPIDKVVCTVTAIDPIEHVLLVVPGTHRVGQCTISSTLENISAAYESSEERQTQRKEIFECQPEKLSTLVEKSKRGFKYVNLRPGQTLFYHPGLIHGFSEDLVNFRKQQLASMAYYAAADCEYVDLRKSAELMSAAKQLPIGLAHFRGRNPSEYTSWIDKPVLLKDSRANL